MSGLAPGRCHQIFMKIVYSLAFFRANASGYESPRAGTSQGIFFDNFIPTVIRACRVVCRDWEIRVHHDERAKDRSNWPLLDRLNRAELIKLVPMGEVKTLCDSMLWRLEPLRDTSVDWVVCRDVDSLPMQRDRKMVEHAIGMGAEAHAILDSESHSGPLMGGMTAYSKGTWGHFFRSKRDGIDMDQHGADQRYLNREIWPLIKSKTVIHQRRRDILYHDAMKTLPVAPQETVLDGIVRHIGAGYDREKAMIALRAHHPDEVLDLVEAAKFSDRDPAITGRHYEPWYTRSAISFLEGYVKSDMSVLEYGGGSSTVWWANRVKKLVTVERDPLWRMMIEENLPRPIELIRQEPECFGPYDIVVVDGPNRLECVKQGMELLKPGGLLILDNADDEGHKACLEAVPWERQDFINKWNTCMWKKPE